jgi:hypothetical protein
MTEALNVFIQSDETLDSLAERVGAILGQQPSLETQDVGVVFRFTLLGLELTLANDMISMENPRGPRRGP